MVVATSNQASFRSGSWRNERSRIVANPAGTRRSQSWPKYSNRAASVPTLSMTLNASDVMNGSSQPITYGTRMRCPDDEIGRNSVSPWTIPMIRAWTTVLSMRS